VYNACVVHAGALHSHSHNRMRSRKTVVTQGLLLSRVKQLVYTN